jgi:predicted nucleic-acid-binding protein
LGQENVKIAVDSNVLVRAITGDNKQQSAIARSILTSAEVIAVPLPVLCELVWVLKQGYNQPNAEIAGALRALIKAPNVKINRQAVEAGLAMLVDGGDFADGVIAFEGRWLGGDEFVSFDRKAVRLLAESGVKARLLSARA